MSGPKVEATVRYKIPGVRGHCFRHSAPLPILSAANWAMQVWEEIEADGGAVISITLYPAEAADLR